MQLIPSVEMQLLDGRSVKLRLNQAALFRASLAFGVAPEDLKNADRDVQFDFSLRVLYEASDVRRKLYYEEFEDALNIPAAIEAFNTLMQRFGDKPAEGDRPLPGSASIGSSGGPSGATILDFPTPSSGDSPPESSPPSANGDESAA